jgi:hypothetical protein
MEELFDIYKNLDLKERIKFDMKYIKFNEEKIEEKIKKRKELVEDLNKVVNEKGQPYFSSEWVKKNIIK